jgi:hypothetical protein
VLHLLLPVLRQADVPLLQAVPLLLLLLLLAGSRLQIGRASFRERVSHQV